MPKLVLEKERTGLEKHDLDKASYLPLTATSFWLDRCIDKMGRITAWLWILTIIVILYSVISRYMFSSGSVMLEEVQWHLAGAAWLLALSYTLVHDDHVRVDILHEKFSDRKKAWIEFLGLSTILMPFLAITIYEMIPYAYASFTQGEQSASPNGLPMRWILKSILPISFILLFIASTSRLLKTTCILFGFPKALAATEKK